MPRLQTPFLLAGWLTLEPRGCRRCNARRKGLAVAVHTCMTLPTGFGAGSLLRTRHRTSPMGVFVLILLPAGIVMVLLCP